MKQSVKEVHKKLEQLQDELDGISFNQMAKINSLEKRIKDLDLVMEILRIENAYDDRGSCVECGQLGEGKSKGFIRCGFHGVEKEFIL